MDTIAKIIAKFTVVFLLTVLSYEGCSQLWADVVVCFYYFYDVLHLKRFVSLSVYSLYVSICAYLIYNLNIFGRGME